MALLTETIRIQDPGTTNYYDVVLIESARVEVPSKTQALEIVELVLNSQDDVDNNTLSDSDVTSIAQAAIAAMDAAGLFA